MALPPQGICNLDKNVKGISGFIGMWESMARDDTTGENQRKHEHLIHY
jgi:hypothetical protein